MARPSTGTGGRKEAPQSPIDFVELRQQHPATIGSDPGIGLAVADDQPVDMRRVGLRATSHELEELEP